MKKTKINKSGKHQHSLGFCLILCVVKHGKNENGKGLAVICGSGYASERTILSIMTPLS